MTKESGELRAVVHLCLNARGNDPGCDGCFLKNKNLCETMISCLERWNTIMLKKYSWKLKFQDHQDILNNTFAEVTEKIENLRHTRSFGAWAYTKFISNMNKHLAEMSRTGTLCLKVPKPPENIKNICASFQGKFAWDQGGQTIELLAYPLSSSVVERAQSIAIFKNDEHGNHRSDWERLLNKLYRLSRSHQKEELDDNQHAGDNQHVSLDGDPSMLLLFSRIEKPWAKDCEHLFKKLFKDDMDTTKIAVDLGITAVNLRKQLSRCYERYREQLTKVLRQISGEQAEYCYQLLQEVLFTFRSTLGPKERKLATVIEKYANQNNIPVEYLDRKIRHCRLMAVQYLEKETC